VRRTEDSGIPSRLLLATTSVPIRSQQLAIQEHRWKTDEKYPENWVRRSSSSRRIDSGELVGRLAGRRRPVQRVATVRDMGRRPGNVCARAKLVRYR
jgi:hypothetical protein